MDSEAIIAVSAAVVGVAQLFKFAGIPDRYGVFLVMGLAVLGVALWAISQTDLSRTQIFSYFAGWVAVATSASGVYGLARGTQAAITRWSGPPSGPTGGGSEPTR